MISDSAKGAIGHFKRCEMKIMEAGYDKVDNSWHRFVTFFPYYRIYYIVNGHAVIYLQNKVLELKPNTLYFIPAFSVFDAHCDEILEHYWFHFNFDAETEKYLTICPPRYEAQPLPPDRKIFSLLVDYIHRPAGERKLHDAIACEGLSKYLFSRFLPDEEEIASSEAARFIPALQYIDENYSRRITNADLGETMYLTPTYFSNLFTRQFGIPPHRYILQKRLNVAAVMLFESDKTIREIAFSCGFENETYFNRQFKKFMGISPGRYRKNSLPLNS